MNFGEKLILLRKEKKMSQQEVAQQLGILSPAYGRYERNENKPSIDMVKKIADLYEASIDYLLASNDKIKMIKDKKMIERISALDSLPESEKKNISYTLDALLRDAKARKAYSE